MIVKIKYDDPCCKIEQHGNWIDLKSLFTITGTNHSYQEIPLGVSMTLPKWYKAEIKPRSSSYKKFGFIQVNSPAEIEHDYSDTWMLPVVFLESKIINKGDRICQFQIKLREDAPWYMKIYDLFRGKFSFKEVQDIYTTRKGLGSTGK